MRGNTIKIYSLQDPIDDQIFYIGMTTTSLQERLSNHLQISNNRNRLLRIKIDSIVSLNSIPIINLIEETTDINRESYWIHEFIKRHDLLNKKVSKSPHKSDSTITDNDVWLNKLFTAIMPSYFFNNICFIPNWRQKLSGKNSNGNRLQFSSEEIEQIRFGLLDYFSKFNIPDCSKG